MANATARAVVLLQISRDEGAEPPRKEPSPLGAVRRPLGTGRAVRDRVRLVCGRFASIGAAAGGRRRMHPTRRPHGGPGLGRTRAGVETAGGPGTSAREGQQGKKPRYERRASSGTAGRTTAREMARVTVRHVLHASRSHFAETLLLLTRRSPHASA